jgi:CRISPR/Cas system-associated exonuclease Cas4 (RecB family)
MRDLIAPILDLKSKKIKRTPCNSNRASELGYAVEMLGGCLRRGVYARTKWQEKELHDVRVQMIFDEGNLQERTVLKDLAEAGVDIIEQQSAWYWQIYGITGHIDGVYCEDGVAYPVEIKSMNPNIFDTIKSYDDFKKKPWTRVYMAQITLYMLSKNIDKGIFILKNKSSGELKQITVDLDYDLGEACIATAEKINQHVLDGSLPDKIKDIQVCKMCPYKLICCPEISFGAELKIKDDPMFEERLKKYLSLKEVKSECEDVYEIIRDEAKAQAEDGSLNIIVGNFVLTGEKDSRGAFRLKIETVKE